MMATYRDLVDRIALDYLNDVAHLPEIKRAIKNAIKAYESQRFWFNTTATALTTSANQSYLAIPSDFQVLDRLEISAFGATVALRETDFATIRQMNAVSAVAPPTHFTYYRDRFELALVPDSAYPVTCYYLQILPALSADADSNAWTNEAQNLITHCAAVDVLANVLHVSPNDPQLVSHVNHMRMARTELDTRRDSRMLTGIRATYF